MKKMMTANELEMINGGVVKQPKPMEIVITRPGPTHPWPKTPDPNPEIIWPRPNPDDVPFEVIEVEQTGRYL